MSAPRLFPSETLTVKRQTNLGEYSDSGFVAEPEFEELTIKCNVQPISGQQLLQVEEGDRDKEIIVIFTSTQLKKHDLVVRDDLEFEVQRVDNWRQPLTRLSHFEVMAYRKDV